MSQPRNCTSFPTCNNESPRTEGRLFLLVLRFAFLIAWLRVCSYSFVCEVWRFGLTAGWSGQLMYHPNAA